MKNLFKFVCVIAVFIGSLVFGQMKEYSVSIETKKSISISEVSTYLNKNKRYVSYI